MKGLTEAEKLLNQQFIKAFDYLVERKEQYGIKTEKEFCKDLGIHQNNLGKYRGKSTTEGDEIRAVPIYAVVNLITRFNLNSDYFILGEEPLFKSTESTLEFESFSNKIAIPIYDIEVRAGIVSRLIDNNDNVPVVGWYYLKDTPNTDGIIGVRAVGDSMIPYITGGDTLLIKRVDKNDYVGTGMAYVIITKNMTVVKYIQKGPDENTWTLESENREKYKTEDIEKEKVIHLFIVVKVIKELTY